jgi:hypothetical protein
MYICLESEMDQQQIDDLNHLVNSYKSKYVNLSDSLIVVFHWWLMQDHFHIDNNSVRKKIFK